MDEKNENPNKKRTVRIIVIVLLLILSLLGLAYKLNEAGDTDNLSVNTTGDTDTEVSDDLLDNSNNQVRIIINPSVTVVNGKVSGLGFVNKNASRHLQCKLKVDEEYIYDSQLLLSGESINNDIIDSNLKTGSYAAVAEIYSYDLDKNIVSQTNVEIQVNVE